MKKLFLFSFLTLLLLQACNKDENTKTPFQGIVLPANYPAPVYDLSQNPVTEAGFTLGKRLFYERLLSRDTTISCGDCHISYAAFSHPDHATSHGIDNLFGKRNAPAIQNMLWSPTFFWDGGVPNLDLVPLNAIQNPVEMDETPAHVLEKLRNHPAYPDLFKAAYGTDEINTARFLQALSQFMGMLVSANSPYNQYVRKEPGAVLSVEALAGLEVFTAKCATCHSGALLTDYQFHNNGILDDFSQDQGRFEISTFPEDIGKFKTPSLHNVAVTDPYMHNGKFKTLRSVLDHYSSGVKDSPSLDPRLRQADGTLGIPLSVEEKNYLIAFLNSLTDEDFLRDVRFAE
ncbi:MAG: cytochrome c peroxidase [Saprospiraceae bacterium]|nr:cytochrome c peroxidase [Saprospiraceae bacterium]